MTQIKRVQEEITRRAFRGHVPAKTSSDGANNKWEMLAKHGSFMPRGVPCAQWCGVEVGGGGRDLYMTTHGGL